MHFSTARRSGVLAVSVATLVACGGSDSGSTGPSTSGASSLVLNGGNGQSAFVGTPVATAPSVLVQDAHGAPVSGIPVTFAVVAGGGSITGATQTTDASGIAAVGSWTLGTSAGVDSLAATTARLPGARVVFTATAAPAILVVQSATDVVNGSTTSPSALVANPGADGISLREAMLATRNSTIPFEITFASALVGQTITPATPLPHITADGTQIVGIAAADSQPGITLDGGALTSGCLNAQLTVAASHVRIEGLRFVHVNEKNRAIQIAGGCNGEPQQFTDIAVVGNVLDNGSATNAGYGIVVTTGGPKPTGSIANLSITHNTFRHYQGDVDAVLIESRGAASTIRNVNVSDNVITDCTFGVELAHPACSNCVIRNVGITGNTFAGTLGLSVSIGNGPVTGAVSSANVMDSVVVSGNTFERSSAVAMLVAAGYGGGSNNTISALWFSNNAVNLSGTTIGAHVTGGADQGSTGNRVRNVVIAGNTFAGALGFAVYVVGGGNGATDNRISSLSVTNNVFNASYNAVGLMAARDVGSVRNRIDSSYVAANLFTGLQVMGLYVAGGWGAPAGNIVSTTSFMNNIVQQSAGGVRAIGGDNGSVGDTVTGFSVVNNTFFRTPGVVVNGSAVNGVDVRNSIFWTPGSSSYDIRGYLTGASISFNIANAPGFTGTNGNFVADPLFVAPDSGNFNLQASSPAIRAGTAIGAPATDYGCNPRGGIPDLGALAYGSTGNRCGSTVPKLPSFGVRTGTRDRRH